MFFFNDTATTEIYTLSLHDALPISDRSPVAIGHVEVAAGADRGVVLGDLVSLREVGVEVVLAREDRPVGDLAVQGKPRDRKSTRLNSSHANISYAVFCLKKK